MIARLTILFSILIAASPVRAAWQTNGTPLNGGGVPHLIADGTGGAIVTWEYWDPWMGQWDYAMGQRVTSGGNQSWQPGGNIVCGSSDQQIPQLVSDGAGGAILVWLDNRNGHLDVYAQRLNGAGSDQWASCGVPIRVGPTPVVYQLAVVSDRSGGAIVVWSEAQGSNQNIFAQRIDANGAALWTANGVSIVTAPSSQFGPVAVSDGAGGAWIAWVDYTSATDANVYARRIDTSGIPQGVASGIALCTAAGNQTAAKIASDGSGGAIVAWTDERTGSDIYAQRVNYAGNAMWATNGVVVCNQAAVQNSPDIASDGTGGAVVAWNDSRFFPNLLAAYAQRINGAGEGGWTADGNLLGYSVPQVGVFPTIISDGSSESIVAWFQGEWNNVTNQTEGVLRVQRLGANGGAQWTPGGVELLRNKPTMGGIQAQNISLVSDGWGGAIVAWEDWRYWQASDVRVGHVSPAGAVTDVGPTRGPSLLVAEVYPNPFSSTASISVALTKPSRLDIDIFDVAGRKVRSLSCAEGDLSQLVELNGRDDAGRPLASGVYFVRVRAAEGTATRKMVIAR